MSRGIQQRCLHRPQLQNRLLGENRNASLPLQRKGIQKGIPMIYPPKNPQAPCRIEHCLGQGGFSRIDMGQDANN